MTAFGYVDHHRIAVLVLRHIRRDRIERRYRKRSKRHFTAAATQIQAGERAVEPVRRSFVQSPLRRGRATKEAGSRTSNYGLPQLFSRDGQRLRLKMVVVTVRIVGGDARRKALRPWLGERLPARRRAAR